MDARTLRTTLIVIAVVAIIFLRLRTRLRPGPVRPGRAFVYVGIIFAATVLSLAGSWSLLITPLGAGLLPVMLAAGVGLGLVLTRTMTFFTGPDGQLWMKGGIVFIAILLGLMALRLGIRLAAVGSLDSSTSVLATPTPLNILSTDLLFLSIGLWTSRAIALWRQQRAHLASEAVILPTSLP